MSTDKFPPENSCDSHLHVVGPRTAYPFATQRAFTPPDAVLADLVAMHRRLGIERAVLIQTSVFGYDNRCMLDALAQLGSNARGVAIVPDHIKLDKLDFMHGLGVRAIRINITEDRRPVVAMAESIAHTVKLCERNGWHLQEGLRT